VVVERFLAVAHLVGKLALWAAWGTGLAALAAGSWWIVGLEPFSLAATVAVVLAGVAAAVAGWTAAHRRRPAGDGSVFGWVVLAAAGGLWQLAAYLQSPRDQHPTLSSLVNALLSSQAARCVAFLMWLAAMFQLARR
jgi:hypothetical protein